jgi:succinate dehydrogenase/fumarate reductase-like Fe-S protein
MFYLVRLLRGATMTPQPQQEYIITKATIKKIIEYSGCEDSAACIKDLLKKEARPAEFAAPQFNSKGLILLARDEWKRREERKRLYDEVSWISGFIGGFITDKTWAKEKIQSLRTKEHP